MTRRRNRRGPIDPVEMGVEVGTVDFSGRPRMCRCHLCGKEYGTRSINIHLNQCKARWMRLENAKPAGQRRDVPPQPVVSFDDVDARSAVAGSARRGHVSDDAIVDAQNDAAYRAWTEHALVRCPHCERRFTAEAHASHRRSCTAERPARRVGESREGLGGGGAAVPPPSREQLRREGAAAAPRRGKIFGGGGGGGDGRGGSSRGSVFASDRGAAESGPCVAAGAYAADSGGEWAGTGEAITARRRSTVHTTRSDGHAAADDAGATRSPSSAGGEPQRPPSTARPGPRPRLGSAPGTSTWDAAPGVAGAWKASDEGAGLGIEGVGRGFRSGQGRPSRSSTGGVIGGSRAISSDTVVGDKFPTRPVTRAKTAAAGGGRAGGEGRDRPKWGFACGTPGTFDVQNANRHSRRQTATRDGVEAANAALYRPPPGCHKLNLAYRPGSKWGQRRFA